MAPTDSSVVLTAPPEVRRIVEKLEAAGYETWAVGGAVRDGLLGRPSQDWDFATRARPEQVRATFGRTVPLGIDHGTVGVLTRSGRMYEVTTFRRDVEPQGRRAVVAFAETLDEDLARRDFTFNAVAWHPGTGTVVDPHQGMRDLESGVLRTVGTPSERFVEDYLRILRGLRFAARFDLSVHPDTWKALVEAVPGLVRLSAERIREELFKSLAGPRPAAALSLYAASGALHHVLPEVATLREVPSQSWMHTLLAVEAIPPTRALLRFAAIMRPVAEAGELDSVVATMTRLRFSNADADAVAHWIRGGPLPDADAPEAERRRWLSVASPGADGRMRLALARARADQVLGARDPDSTVRAVNALRTTLRSRPALHVGDLAIGGRDLIRRGIPAGPRIGVILRSLLDEVIEEPGLNHPEALLARALELAATSAGSEEP